MLYSLHIMKRLWRGTTQFNQLINLQHFYGATGRIVVTFIWAGLCCNRLLMGTY
jgi:hypothetical protein